MSVDPLESFLDNLEQSRLLNAGQFAAAREHIAQQGSALTAQQLARWLIERTWLTRWQAKMLLSGRKTLILGKYRLLDQLGQGGMGAVFRAQQEGLGRIVALKVMSRQLLKDKGAVARFHREIQAAAALTHPNIVAAYDADRVGGTHFLVMEYVAGRTLDEIARQRGQLPIDEACEYIRQAAVGLQHAHERGMIHRDIKPANLLVARDDGGGPLVKILDMGLARFSSELSEEGGLTRTGQIMGTPDYIAPEQARNTKNADIRSDIFSLGCSLFRLLAGELPFPGDTVMAKLMARGMHDARRIGTLRPEVPPALDTIVAQMLARDPAERFSTPVEVAAALAPFAGAAGGGRAISVTHPAAEDRPVGAFPAPDADLFERTSRVDPALDELFRQLAVDADLFEPQLDAIHETSRIGTATAETSLVAPEPSVTPAAQPKTGRSARIESQRRQERRRLAAGGAIAALVIAVFVAVSIWYRAGETVLIVDLPESEREGDVIEIDGVKRALPKTGELRFPGRPGRRIIRLSRTGYLPTAEELNLERGEVRTFRPDWRPTEETARRLALADLRRRVEQHASRDAHAAETQALRSEILALARARFGTADERSCLDLLPQLAWPADMLLRDGIPRDTLIAAGDGNPDAVPAEVVGILGDNRLKHWGAVWRVAWTNSGQLATVGNDLVLRLWDAAAGTWQQSLAGAERVFAVSASGKWAAARNVQGSITLWDLSSGAARSFGEELNSNPNSLSFNHDDTRLSAGMEDGDVVVWTVPDLKLQFRRPSGAARIGRLVCSPDGALLAGFGDDRKVRVWSSTDGAERHVFSTPGNRLRALAFHPAGKLLACGMWLPEEHGAGTAQVWDVETGREVIIFPSFTPCSSVAFSPDGRLFAAGSDAWDESGHVYCWEVNGWRPVWRRRISAGEMAVLDLAFSSDSRTIAAAGETSRVHLLDADSGEPRPRLDRHHAAAVSSVAWSPDGRSVVSGSYDTTAIVWDVATSSPRHVLAGHEKEVYAVRYSPDGRTIATAGRDETVILWDAETGTPSRRMFGHNYRASALAFSPDGRLLVSGGWDRQAILWDVAKGVELGRPAQPLNEGILCLDISRDGRFLATATAGTKAEVSLWELPALRRKQTWSGFADSILSVNFTPDGSHLIAAGAPIKRIEISTGKASTLSVDRPSFLALSPDGRRAALYRYSRLRLTAADFVSEQFSIPLGLVRQAAFSPDGRHLATANANGTVYLIRLP